jgi:hypothetical protein
MKELNFSIQSTFDGKLICDFIFASFVEVVNSIKRHKLTFLENKEPECCLKPSSSTSRNKGHKS